jgi:hypothetical protein
MKKDSSLKYFMIVIFILILVIIAFVSLNLIDSLPGKEEGITCIDPFVTIDGKCCVDEDANGICDSSEVEEEIIVDPVEEEEVRVVKPPEDIDFSETIGSLVYDLSDFPAPFIIDETFQSNSVIIVGNDAPGTDTFAALDLSSYLQSNSLNDASIATQVEREVESIDTLNFILIGHPCDNSLVETVFDFTCDSWPYSEGEAVISIKNHGGDRVALLVGGTTDEDTQMAGKALLEYDSYDWCGNEAIIRGTADSFSVDSC